MFYDFFFTSFSGRWIVRPARIIRRRSLIQEARAKFTLVRQARFTSDKLFNSDQSPDGKSSSAKLSVVSNSGVTSIVGSSGETRIAANVSVPVFAENLWRGIDECLSKISSKPANLIY
jgi:hypothetical protein